MAMALGYKFLGLTDTTVSDADTCLFGTRDTGQSGAASVAPDCQLCSSTLSLLSSASQTSCR